MAGEPDSEIRTALVVLASSTRPAPGPGGYTLESGPPGLPEGAELVRKWFSSKGFVVDPVVGISFSISGPGSVFRSTFGDVAAASAAELGPAELGDRLDAEVLRHVAAIAIGPTPDFGPGNA